MQTTAQHKPAIFRNTAACNAADIATGQILANAPEKHKKNHSNKIRIPRVFPLDSNPLIIGSGGDSGLHLDHESLKPHHCILQKKGDSYWLDDLLTDSKTLVNNKPIIRKKLSADDLIQVGQFRFKFVDASYLKRKDCEHALIVLSSEKPAIASGNWLNALMPRKKNGNTNSKTREQNNQALHRMLTPTPVPAPSDDPQEKRTVNRAGTHSKRRARLPIQHLKVQFNAMRSSRVLQVLAASFAAFLVATTQVPPTVTDAKSLARDNILSTVRDAIAFYQTQHNAYPGTKASYGGHCPEDSTAGIGVPGSQQAFIEQLTMFTNINGQTCSKNNTEFRFGPYLKNPVLPLEPSSISNRLTIVNLGTNSITGGWIYDPVNGTFEVNTSN